MRSINPATEEVIATFEEDSDELVEEKLSRAWGAFERWRGSDFDRRASLMEAAAEVLDDDRERWARLMTDEMGKPLAAARSEVDKCAWVCRYFAEHAESFLAPETIPTDAHRSLLRFDPMGPVLAIMPWNFPFWQVFRFAAPHLMGGNVGLLKHASNVQGCARAIETIFREAGFPHGAFTTLYLPGSRVDAVLGDRRIRAVTLTGSTGAGKKVAEAAGRHLKKSVLELGGSDPFIVLADADLDEAVDKAVLARTINSGQSCIAAKRFIVEDAIYDRFLSAFTDRLAALNVGDPTDDANDLGPQARDDLRRDLHDQVERSVAAGAECVLGGELPEGRGYYYPVTLLTGVEPGMAAFDEETFGPVAAVTRARDTAQAIELANRSRFGLGAAVFTARERGAELAARIESGHVAINGIVKSDPRLPFGGIKDSGYGRELGREGLLEFQNRKTVWIG